MTARPGRALQWQFSQRHSGQDGAHRECIAVCDGLKGLPEAVNTVWDRTIIQTCVIHRLRNTFRYASRKYWDQIARDIRPVYTAAAEAAAKERFVEFTAKWAAQYPAIIRFWGNAWSEFVPFLDYGACRRIGRQEFSGNISAWLRSRDDTSGCPLSGEFWPGCRR